MGRYRKPPQQEIMEGSPGKRPIRVGAIPDNEIGPPPHGLSPAARKIWDRVSQEWSLTLTSADREAFEHYCCHAALHARLRRAADELGMFDTDAKGQTCLSAAFRALMQSEAMMLKYWATFGATPGTRGRVPAKSISYPKARKGGLEVLQGGKTDP